MSDTETCAITGLPFVEGTAVRMVLINDDYAQGTGARAMWGLASPPLEVVFLGDEEFAVQRGEAEQELRYEIFRVMAGVDDYDVLKPRYVGSHRMWLLSEAAFKFLPTLASMEEEHETLEKEAAAYYECMREACKDYVANEVSGAEENPGGAEDAWMDADENYNEGNVDLSRGVRYFVGDNTRFKGYLQATSDMLMLHKAMAAIRRKFYPTLDMGEPAGTHEQISELARFVRRKAIAAGFAGGAE